MVKINQGGGGALSSRSISSTPRIKIRTAFLFIIVLTIGLYYVLLLVLPTTTAVSTKRNNNYNDHAIIANTKGQLVQHRQENINNNNNLAVKEEEEEEKADNNNNNKGENEQHDNQEAKSTSSSSSATAAANVVCPITKISELLQEERYPMIGERHMVQPPKGGKVVLVCCNSTKGPLSIMVHEQWAPMGATRFLDMVNNNYFNNATVPMMRCMKNFLCQFGLSSNPKVTKKYNQIIQDDIPWLPQGPKNRQNINGIKRFPIGYLAYAGGGTNSRSNQFIIALKNNGALAGGSPWEVPWGELVGKYSFISLSKIYTGYDEKGPSQGKLHRLGMTEEMKKEFINLDYITGCSIVDQEEQKTITTG